MNNKNNESATTVWNYKYGNYKIISNNRNDNNSNNDN